MPDRIKGLPIAQLFDAAPDGVIVCDQAGHILLVNAEVERIFAYERDELIGHGIDQLIPERARQQHAHYVSRYAGTPRLRPMGIGMELSGRRKDGSEVPIEISLSPTRTADGLFITAGIRDVSERRRLERENRRANAYLVSAVDGVREAFAVFDECDRVLMLNSAARHLLAPIGGSIIGLTFVELLDKALDTGVFDFSNESRSTLQTRWLAYHAQPEGVLDVRTGTGRFLRVRESKTAEHGTVSTIADITDDILREEELRAARAAAEAASAAKSEFLSSMSHELRTPLNAVLGFAQLLERDRKRPLDERQRERIEHVLRGGQHLLRLIDDVLDLSSIEAGRIAVSNEPVEVGNVIDDVVASLEPLAARSGIRVSRLSCSGVPPALADRTRLVQILMNFGSNAIKYGRQGGFVELAAEARGDAVRVSVTDDGIGIPVEKQASVFEPFQRAGQETGPIEGTGIGLAIAQRLAKLMLGRVGFSSMPGAGSTFWVEVPAHRDQPRALTPLAELAPRLAHNGAHHHTLVYIEDNPANIAFVTALVDELPGVSLLTASTAERGLELIRAHLPDAIIMDINLPGMSGLDATRRLRDWPDTRGIPVIGLSAAALARDTALAAEVGFYRYLTKPIQIGALLEALDEVLAHRRDEASVSTTSASETGEKSA